MYLSLLLVILAIAVFAEESPVMHCYSALVGGPYDSERLPVNCSESSAFSGCVKLEGMLQGDYAIARSCAEDAADLLSSFRLVALPKCEVAKTCLNDRHTRLPPNP